MRKLLFGILIFGFGLTAFIVWQQRQGNAELRITTETGAEIFLTDPSKPLTPKSLGREEAVIRLRKGTYTIEARLNNQATRQAVSIDNNGDQSAHLPLKPLKALESVGNYTGRDIYSAGSTTNFLNVPAQQIYTLRSGQNGATRFQPVVYPVTRIHWISSSQAIVEQPGKKFLWLSDGEIKTLVLTGATIGDNRSNIQDLTANERGQIAYIASGQLYFKASPSANSISITKLNESAKASLSPSGDIGIYFSAEERSHNDEPTPDSFVINPHNGQIRKLPPSTDPIEVISWSTDGKQLIYPSGSTARIYNLATQQSQLVLGSRPSNTQSFTWVNPAELLYIDADSIWLYNANSELSHKLVNTPADINQPHPLRHSNSAIYFGTDPPGDFGTVGKIYRFRL